MKKENARKKIAVLGVSGYVGQHLLKRFEPAQNSTVVGVDINVPLYAPPWLKFYQLDVRQPFLRDILARENIDTVVHLAFVLGGMDDTRLMHDINVNGTKNVLASAAAAGLQRVVLVTSTAVYGANNDNPPMLTEDTPLMGHPGFPYLRNQLAIEELAEKFRTDNEKPIITTLRPCVVYGRRTRSFLIDFLRKSPILPMPGGANPKLQFIHVEDLARAIFLATEKGRPGAYNIVSTDTISFLQVADILGKKVIYAPTVFAYTALEVLQYLGLGANMPPYMLDFISRNWVADGSKAEEHLGFKARYSSTDALKSMLRN